MQERIP